MSKPNNDSKLYKQSYMLKRLRDSGYKADKLIGLSDPNSLKNDLKKISSKLFIPSRTYTGDEIFEKLVEFRADLVRFMYIPPSYNLRDCRMWTIIIDSGGDSVLLTFYKNAKSLAENYEEYGNDYFEIYDGGQYVRPLRKRIKTFSFEVISQELNNMGIIKKYNNE